MTLHHDDPNTHITGFNFLDYWWLNALPTTSHSESALSVLSGYWKQLYRNVLPIWRFIVPKLFKVYKNICVRYFFIEFHQRPESLAIKNYRVVLEKSKNISLSKNYNWLLNKTSFEHHSRKVHWNHIKILKFFPTVEIS